MFWREASRREERGGALQSRACYGKGVKIWWHPKKVPVENNKQLEQLLVKRTLTEEFE